MSHKKTRKKLRDLSASVREMKDHVNLMHEDLIRLGYRRRWFPRLREETAARWLLVLAVVAYAAHEVLK